MFPVQCPFGWRKAWSQWSGTVLRECLVWAREHVRQLGPEGWVAVVVVAGRGERRCGDGNRGAPQQVERG